MPEKSKAVSKQQLHAIRQPLNALGLYLDSAQELLTQGQGTEAQAALALAKLEWERLAGMLARSEAAD